MIVVDMEIEAMDRTYDFKLDESVPISKIIDDICELVAQKEKCASAKQPEKLVLCNKSTGQILPQDMSLKACGVISGEKLMLI